MRPCRRALSRTFLNGQHIRTDERRLLTHESIRAFSTLSQERHRPVGRSGGGAIGRADVKGRRCLPLRRYRSLVCETARRIRLSMLLSSDR